MLGRVIEELPAKPRGHDGWVDGQCIHEAFRRGGGPIDLSHVTPMHQKPQRPGRFARVHQ
eukprot:2428126-Amphidinium_carterae.1